MSRVLAVVLDGRVASYKLCTGPRFEIPCRFSTLLSLFTGSVKTMYMV